MSNLIVQKLRVKVKPGWLRQQEQQEQQSWLQKAWNIKTWNIKIITTTNMLREVQLKLKSKIFVELTKIPILVKKVYNFQIWWSHNSFWLHWYIFLLTTEYTCTAYYNKIFHNMLPAIISGIITLQFSVFPSKFDLTRVKHSLYLA